MKNEKRVGSQDHMEHRQTLVLGDIYHCILKMHSEQRKVLSTPPNPYLDGFSYSSIISHVFLKFILEFLNS